MEAHVGAEIEPGSSLDPVMDWVCTSPQSSYFEALIPKMIIFVGIVFKR